MNLPDNLKYTSDHEWIKLLDNDEAIVGITDFAQQSLGDITFVETPEEGDTFDRGATFGVVESVKAASDLYMPVDAAVIEGNSDLEDAPEQVNQSPFDEGWIIKIKILDASQIGALLDASAYAELAKE
ncbi:glycine cleavage system protein GcvH [Candidatus Pelagisphaera phototrophica]|uniref:glycine cleavage system protein GcvH n=1 Tax=Candidatus Pelagisphaera phototrophica TaxID=2684113 RepID=UPI0019F2D820|nr:glycine cleavage system protein GcvH [Candidatus Pelagisphaera phototrophica]QXD31153.1 glycine cleavage system protein GcvH [Candidatus Pelagisphaera phototrophica]